MRRVKRFFARLPLYLLWLLFSVMFWSWVFTLLTDTRAENKVTVFVDAWGVEDTALAAALERELPEGIKMVKVHPFTYAMFDESAILNADIFIVRESAAAGYIDSFAPLPELKGEAYYTRDGVPWGVKVFDGETLTGAAESYIRYWAEGTEREDYYLFFGVNSLHTGKVDDAAFFIAERLMETE